MEPKSTTCSDSSKYEYFKKASFLDKYELKQTNIIGKGAFGEVFLAK